MTQKELNTQIKLIREGIMQASNDIDDYYIDNFTGMLNLINTIGSLVVGDEPASGQINPLVKPRIRARMKIIIHKCDRALEGNLEDAVTVLDKVRNACEATLLEINNDRPIVAVIERDTVIRWMREIERYLNSQKQTNRGNFMAGDLSNIERVVNQALEEL